MEEQRETMREASERMKKREKEETGSDGKRVKHARTRERAGILSENEKERENERVNALGDERGKRTESYYERGRRRVSQDCKWIPGMPEFHRAIRFSLIVHKPILREIKYEI